MADAFDEVAVVRTIFAGLTCLGLIAAGTILGVQGHENLATGAFSGAVGLLVGGLLSGGRR